MKLTVVVATWNEAETIAEAVTAARAIGDEVIVVDGGSTDGTAKAAAAAGARVVVSEKGRGHQLRAGAEHACGDVLLFLHADVRLDPGARNAIERALDDPSVAGGSFFLQFEGSSFPARLFTLANHVRRRALRIYYGDSAIFVRAATYASLGGFRAMPLFEDYDFVRRLERHGRTAYVREVVAVASARRFEHAPIRTLALWSLLQTLFSLGVSPVRLAKLYADARPVTSSGSASPRFSSERASRRD